MQLDIRELECQRDFVSFEPPWREGSEFDQQSTVPSIALEATGNGLTILTV